MKILKCILFFKLVQFLFIEIEGDDILYQPMEGTVYG